MPNKKPVIKTAFLSPERDAKLLDYLNRPEISTSAAIRQGLRLLVQKEDDRQTFEEKALDMLDQIIGVLSGNGISPTEKPETDQYNDPFLDSSL